MKRKMVQAGFPEQQIRHVYNFADNEKFAHEVVSDRERTVVFLGRLSEEKGLNTLCSAFRELDGHFVLKVFGDGALREALDAEYSSDSIQFMGFQPWEFIKESLSTAACMVIPSEWYENNPLSIIESLAVGTPVLGSAIGGIPELIEEGVNGMTFKVGDSRGLTVALQKMMDVDDWSYSRIQVDAKAKFSSGIYYDAISAIYADVA